MQRFRTDADLKPEHDAHDDCNCQPVCLSPRHVDGDDDDDDDDDDVQSCDEMDCDAGAMASPTDSHCDTTADTNRKPCQHTANTLRHHPPRYLLTYFYT